MTRYRNKAYSFVRSDFGRSSSTVLSVIACASRRHRRGSRPSSFFLNVSVSLFLCFSSGTKVLLSIRFRYKTVTECTAIRSPPTNPP